MLIYFGYRIAYKKEKAIRDFTTQLKSRSNMEHSDILG